MRLRREVDFTEGLLRVLTRSARPAYLPFYEHIASPGFIADRTGDRIGGKGWWREGYHAVYVDFWTGMGFDCVPMEIHPNIRLPEGEGGVTRGSEAQAVVRSMEDFERFDWPDEAAPIDFRHFEEVGRLLPDGVKIVGGVGAGPYEWVSRMMGVMGLSYALYEAPDLVRAMFERIGALHVSAVRQLAQMDCVGALRQGDDLGFKTSTFLPPDVLRAHVFPIYRRMVEAAHAAGKPFILHSCGNLEEVYEDLVGGCGIDAKHSFEDAILPVAEFKRRYGDRVTPLGGLDVDRICRDSPEAIRAYAREHIEACFDDGFWALGTGNSLTDYMPVGNYLVALEEGLRARV